MTDLLDRLFEAQVGGCSCMTKTPNIEHHKPTCHFRLHEEASQEIRRLRVQWEKAATLLNEFRPVTGTDEWVAVRVGALNYVLMAASPTPAVGPLLDAGLPHMDSCQLKYGGSRCTCGLL